MAGFNADELSRYTSLSSLAVLALVIAVLSVFAVLVPLLIVLPILGIILSVGAHLRIHASEGGLSGDWLVRTALFVSVVCVVAAPMRFFVRDTLYKRQADAVARQWVQLVSSGKTKEAFGLLSGGAIRSFYDHSPGAAADDTPTPEVLAHRLAEKPLCRKLAEASQHGGLKLVQRNVALGVRGPSPIAAIRYESAPRDSGEKLEFSIDLIHLDSSPQPPSWRVESWQLAAK